MTNNNVDNAFITGVAPERIIAKIYIGKVIVEAPEQKNDKIKSSKETIKTNNDAPIIAGDKSGTIIFLNVCHSVAPRSNDASVRL